MADEYLAHIAEDGRTQTVLEHCMETARYAAECLAPVQLDAVVFLAGLVHDLGKYEMPYQEYLINAAYSEDVRRGSVIHSFQGCRYVLETFHRSGAEDYSDITAELIAYAIGAHHGLFDCIDAKQKSGFLHRLCEQTPEYQDAVARFIAESSENLENCFEKANLQMQPVYAKLNAQLDDNVYAFQIGMLSRMLLSAVIEGDRRSTREFMNPDMTEAVASDIRTLWSEHLNYMEQKLAEFSGDSPIQKARCWISDQCRAAANGTGRVFRLNVPTGGGKTLSALRFALAHAAKERKQRIIFTAPLLSILEQNADVIRCFIGDDGIVLEHHSNVVRTAEAEETLDFKELLCENWHSPVIISTMVQLLNTLFSGKTTAIRRMHALANSIIVIDEVQAIPNRMIALFNQAVDFLAQYCGTTFVLCSATQPGFEVARDYPVFTPIVNMVPPNPAISEVFKRTEFRNAGAMKLEEIPDFLSEVAADTKSLLVICNKRAEAESLFHSLPTSDGETHFHLSASMCIQHRRDVLKELQSALEAKKKVICIATQVVEAGVDISFETVVRLSAGMDNIVQAAGRCNRNGESQKPKPVYIVECEGENLAFLPDIQAAKESTSALMTAFRKSPQRFDNDLASEGAIQFFYRHRYANLPAHAQEYPLPKRMPTLFGLLSCNGFGTDGSEGYDQFYMVQAFKTAGEFFQVFDNDTDSAIVPYKNGEKLIRELSTISERDYAALAHWQERAKPYMVSLYSYQEEKFRTEHAVYECNGVMVLQTEYYDAEGVGLLSHPKIMDFLEV